MSKERHSCMERRKASVKRTYTVPGLVVFLLRVYLRSLASAVNFKSWLFDNFF